jgi:hypothetical protein
VCRRVMRANAARTAATSRAAKDARTVSSETFSG